MSIKKARPREGEDDPVPSSRLPLYCGGLLILLAALLLNSSHVRSLVTSTLSRAPVKSGKAEPESPLQRGTRLLNEGNYEEALKQFTSLRPTSPVAAALGVARSLDQLADSRQSNELLERAIKEYGVVLAAHGQVADSDYLSAGLRLADRQSFRGWSTAAVDTLKILSRRLPNNVVISNRLAIELLVTGDVTAARQQFRDTLKRNSSDGVALVHLGFIAKTEDLDISRAVSLLQRGLASGDPDTRHGRFYYHLGEGLLRLGRRHEADKVHAEAASLGLFLSAQQRSLYNLPHLTARPWWTPAQTKQAAGLKAVAGAWREIRAEGEAQLAGALFKHEDENLRDSGHWKQLTLFQRGRRDYAACAKTPLTCDLLEKHLPAATTCTRGQVKFSVMHAGTHVWPHTGPTNCRLRAHLGLITPPGPVIRVGEEAKEWRKGEFIIFDDSFEHEVWHNGTDPRLVLIVDIWHPGVTEKQKRELSPI